MRQLCSRSAHLSYTEKERKCDHEIRLQHGDVACRSIKRDGRLRSVRAAARVRPISLLPASAKLWGIWLRCIAGPPCMSCQRPFMCNRQSYCASISDTGAAMATITRPMVGVRMGSDTAMVAGNGEFDTGDLGYAAQLPCPLAISPSLRSGAMHLFWRASRSLS